MNLAFRIHLNLHHPLELPLCSIGLDRIQQRIALMTLPATMMSLPGLIAGLKQTASSGLRFSFPIPGSGDYAFN